MEEKVVTVEKCHGCTNGLRIKKTNHKMHTRDTPPRSPTPLGPRLSVARSALCSLCIQMGPHVSQAHKHAL